MGYKVIYSEHFQFKLIATTEYIADRFSLKTAADFLNEMEFKIERLQEQPLIGRISKQSDVRKLKVGKYNLIYYRITKECIEILDLFDQRQHPDKSKY